MCTYQCTLPLQNKPSEYVLHNLEIGMQSQDSESGQCNLEIAKFSDCTEQMKGLEPEWSNLYVLITHHTEMHNREL